MEFVPTLGAKIAEGLTAPRLRVPQKSSRILSLRDLSIGDQTAHRPGKRALYDDDIHPRVALTMTRAGLSDPEIAEAFGLSVHLFDRWLKRHPQLAQAYRIGSDLADARVERGLFRRATGYEYETTKVTVHEGIPSAIRYTKHIAPDFRAIEFWLSNRRPDLWAKTTERLFDEPPRPLAPGATKQDSSYSKALMELTDEELRSQLEQVLGKGQTLNKLPAEATDAA